MKKKQMKKSVSLMLATLILVCSFGGTAMAKNDVKYSKTNYYVEMNESSDLFIYNKRSIGSKVGTEYYMTYTVESLDAEKAQFYNQGIIGTNHQTSPYPYVTTEDGRGGLYKLTNANRLLIEGNTYFFKFKITEDGYEYKVGWATEGKSKYIKFDVDIGDVKTDLGYFGVYFGAAGLSGKLVKVRCYDKDGNDLGVQITGGRNANVGRENPIAKDTQVGHTYTITVKDSSTVAISNRKAPTSDTVYMEYKVKSSEGTHVYQTGVIHNNAPLLVYPYESGYMYFDKFEYDPKKIDAGPLLVPGAEYLILFEKRQDTYEVTIQKTLNGKVSYITLAEGFGTFIKDADFYSLWFGEGVNFPVNIVLTDFKCYDSNKNNLGVQCNKPCEIIHYGELEDYAGCEAMYACKEDDSLYALYEDQKLKYTENNNTTDGTYRIEKDVMTVSKAGETIEYDYLYQFFTDESEKVYRRLGTYKITFETGEGNEIDSQIINAENGYMAMRPTDPVLDGNTFEGWYTSEGEKYDFDEIVTESVTLYAKWEKVEYTVADMIENFGLMNYVILGGSVLIMIAAITCGIWIIVRGKKNANKK